MRRFLAILLSLCFAACQQNQEKPISESPAEIAQKFSLEMQTTPKEVNAGEPIEFIFTVKDDKGSIVKDLEIFHEKPMHLIVVSTDLAEFYHLHPELQKDGSLKLSMTFPNGGDYKLYAEFKPKKVKNEILKILDLRVSGNQREKAELKPDEKLDKIVDGLRVSMKREGMLIAGQPTTLKYKILDPQTNKPVGDLEEYLGEIAHFVVINSNLNEFSHSHAFWAGAHRRNKNSHHEHQHSHSPEKEIIGTDEDAIMTEVTFPKEGIYKIWMEFQRNGKVTTVPFVVEVGTKEEIPAIASEVRVPDDVFKVAVTEKGFLPQEIHYKQGKPLKLGFIRASDKSCGSEVVFEQLGIKKQLPFGEPVIVEIPTEKEGIINFTCGMKMLKGKIIIQKTP
ncbi:MAG: cupredoxin domain-containing protein [Acidobacteria bacterium]|jgi:hypothetical protein|nr:MAG: cupredoxin domain-containing protein [Acidobacteriota bacterium]GIU83069.1 MAG: hypothetical protein KatS3mg006_2133 [Pyrinomonadaceae bacterium]